MSFKKFILVISLGAVFSNPIDQDYIDRSLETGEIDQLDPPIASSTVILPSSLSPITTPASLSKIAVSTSKTSQPATQGPARPKTRPKIEDKDSGDDPISDGLIANISLGCTCGSVLLAFIARMVYNCYQGGCLGCDAADILWLCFARMQRNRGRNAMADIAMQPVPELDQPQPLALPAP